MIISATTIDTPGPVLILPLESPLAELSPRFANNNYPNKEKPLSPTFGQLRFIEADLSESWKFANVPFQNEPANKAIYRFVRPDGDKVIEEVRMNSTLTVLTKTSTATCGEVHGGSSAAT